MVSSAVVRRAILASAALAALALPAQAQGKLDARYTATLGGVQIGKGAWVIELSDDQFTAAASGAATGLLKLFAAGQGTGASRGFINNGQMLPISYAATITADKKTEDIRINLGGGHVKDFSVNPPTMPDPGRVPLTESHRRNASDPMTAALVRVSGTADPVGPEACQRTSAIFDGRMRYNLQFAYKRIEQVKAEKGYEGPAVVCGVFFTPVAGHIPDRAAIKYLTELRTAEVWLAPVTGTRVLVPFRVSIPTPVGVGVLQATQFVSLPRPASAAATRSQ